VDQPPEATTGSASSNAVSGARGCPCWPRTTRPPRTSSTGRSRCSRWCSCSRSSAPSTWTGPRPWTSSRCSEVWPWC